MIKFNILRTKDLFHFTTPMELYLTDPRTTVDLFGWTKITKNKKTGKIIILKKEGESTIFKMINYPKFPVGNLKSSKPDNVNALIFQSPEDMNRFEEQVQNNIVEVSSDGELANYEVSPEYEALCKESIILLYND